jgi:hypothetical protein
MNINKHNAENVGAKLRDHTHPRRHFLKRAHRDWRVWVSVGIMIALILVYAMTDNLSLIPGSQASQPMPADIMP